MIGSSDMVEHPSFSPGYIKLSLIMDLVVDDLILIDCNTGGLGYHLALKDDIQ